MIKNYITIKGKNFYDQSIDSDVKRHERIGKLTAGEDENFTTGWILDYNFIKNHYRLITVDLSWQKKLYTDPKPILQIEFVG